MNGILKDPGGWGREAVRTKRRYRLAQLQALGFTCVVVLICLALASAGDGALGSCDAQTSALDTTLLASGLAFAILGTLLWPLMYLRALRAIVLESSPAQRTD
jgi:hypothetical protein